MMCDNSRLSDTLKADNHRLASQLSVTNKCLTLLEKYRNHLTLIADNCLCDRNAANKSKLNELEVEYRTVLDDAVRDAHCAHIVCDNNDNTCGQSMSKQMAQQNQFNYYSLSLLNTENRDIDDSDDPNVSQLNEMDSECVEVIPELLTIKEEANDETAVNSMESSIEGSIESSDADRPTGPELTAFGRPKMSSVAYNYFSYNGKKSAPFVSRRRHTMGSSVGYVTKYQSMLSHNGLFSRGVPPEASYHCNWPNCGQTFKRDYYLKRHLQTHSVEKPFRCDWPQCTAAFKQNCLLNRHKLIHSGVKPYVCDYPNCEKRFARIDKLKCHRMTHTGEKRFECPYSECGKKFSRADKLKGHLMRHTGERPFKCDCGRDFTEKRSLSNHMKSHTEPNVQLSS